MLQRQACAGAPDDLSKQLDAAQFNCTREFIVREGVEVGRFLIGVGLLGTPALANVEEELEPLHVVVRDGSCIHQSAYFKLDGTGIHSLPRWYFQPIISIGLVRLFTFIDTSPMFSMVNCASTIWR